jgi:Ca-activated chloride channel family protein
MLVVAALFAVAAPVRPQDIIIEDPPPWLRRPNRWGIPVLDITAYEVRASVRDQAARVEIEATFRNPAEQPLAEGHFVMSVPRGAVADQFRMTVNGEEMAAELLDATQARQIYENYLRRYIDPGLLEMTQNGLLRARVFPIPAGGEIRIRVAYRAILEKRGGTVELRLPMARFREGSEPVGAVRADVELRSSEPIGHIYSPSHALAVSREDARTVRIRYEAASYSGRQDLAIFYAVSDAPMGMTLLTYKPADEDGYFLLLASPRVDLPEGQVLARNFVFALDRSGSMQGEKFRQAREAVRYCIEHLREIDRFNIVDYATEVRSWSPDLQPATEENRNRALRYLDELAPGGGTNIEGALSTALAMFAHDAERVPMLFFATDGLPTVGVRDFGGLMRIAREQNRAGVRLFALGVGTDVNTLLLDRLAEDGNGARDYVLPEENVAERVAMLYDKTSAPVLADVRLEAPGWEPYDMYPQRRRDIYRGDQIAIVGRFRSSQPASIALVGRAEGEERRFEIRTAAPSADAEFEFLPRLWAGRKIDWLVDEIRMTGDAPQEVVDEIVQLARRYGIVTPYTSYLVAPDDTIDVVPVLRRGLEEMTDRARASGFSGAGLTRQAIEESRRLAERREALQSEQDIEAAAGLAAGGRAQERVRYAGSRTFYNRDGVWVDSLVDPQVPEDSMRRIRAGSDEFVDLLRRHPEVARWIVGYPTVLRIGGEVYRIDPPVEEPGN